MNRVQLERKYGIHIADDSYINGFGKIVKRYKYYSADGCPFSNNLPTIKAVEKDCKYWEMALLDIRDKVQKYF